jgi:hypothetical protein
MLVEIGSHSIKKKASIMLISDASTSDADSVDFVISRAEAAK